ncbi:MAG: methyl-accepting chemotaxis protein [Dehalococcoidia bacterium]
MRRTIRLKLFLGFGIVVAALIGTGIFATMQLKSVGNDATDLFSNRFKTEVESGAVRREMLLMRERILAYVLAPEEARPQIAEEIASHERGIDDATVVLRAHEGLTERQAELLTEVEQNNTEWFATRDAETIALVDAGNTKAAAETVLSGNANDAFQRSLDAILLLNQETSLAAEQAHDSAIATQNRAMILMIGIVIGVMLVAGGIAAWISQGIVSNVKRMLAAADRIADGDVEQDIGATTDDEIGDMAQAFQRMVGYLKEMAMAATRIADGDLTKDVRPRSQLDLLGTSFSRMTENLRSLLGQAIDSVNSITNSRGQLAEAADQSAQASQQVASTSNQLAEGASSQARSAQEANENISQLGSAVEEVSHSSEVQSRTVGDVTALGERVSEGADQMSQNAQEAAAGARDAAETANNGASMVRKTFDAIDRIKAAMGTTSEEIAKLGGQSTEIGNIVAVIDDIADQTNLLALNAAIEAARAGEQGRGFAVVADEVRSLAERVASATKEIAVLITGVQRGVDASVASMKDASSEMDSGSQLSTEAGNALAQIVSSIEEVAAQIEQIAGGSEELKASGSEMTSVIAQAKEALDRTVAAVTQMQSNSTSVSDAIGSMAGIAEENAAATEEVSASAQELTAQAEEVTASAHALGEMTEALREHINRFRTEQESLDSAAVVDLDQPHRLAA